MDTHIQQRAEELTAQTTAALRQTYTMLFGEPTNTRNRQFLIKRILWREQSLAHGDLPQRARERAMTLARDADLRMNPPRTLTRDAPAGGPGAEAGVSFEVSAPPVPGAGVVPGAGAHHRLPPPGTTLTRLYQGRRLCVTVLEQGFELEGTVYKSLSAVAKAVTGTHWNGYHFFGLNRR